MNTSLQIVENAQFGKVRLQMINEVPWFCANDVCDVLGYENKRDAIAKHVDKEDVAKCDATDNLGRVSKKILSSMKAVYIL